MSRLLQAFAALRLTARNADIRRAELAWGAVISAEWAHFVALGVFAYNHGGSTAVGIAGLMRLLPAAAIAPFATSLADRFRRERFLLAIAVVGAAALAVSAAGALMDDRIIVFTAGSAVGACSTLFRPALMALLPSLARTAAEMISSYGATATIESLGTLLGPLGAGVLVAFAEVEWVFGASAAALLMAAALLVRVTAPGRVHAPASGTGASVWRGFAAIREVPHVRLLVGLIAAQTFVRGCLNVLIVVTAYQVLHEGATEVGYLAAAIGAGGLFGALGAISLRGERLAPPFTWGLVFWGLPIVLIAPLPSIVSVILLLAVIGAANSIVDVAGFTLVQRAVPDEVLTRVLGVLWGLAMGTVAIGSFVAPAILSLIGVRPTFVVVGVILPVLALVSYRQLRELDAATAPASQLGLVERLPVFAPLSIVAKERIATHLIEVDVAAGDVVIRVGETGDRFYIVAEGELTIDAGSQTIAIGPGHFFGEIALLRGIPRTATVQADTDARLYALERDDFLAVMTGNSLAQTEADAVASERMEANAAAAARREGH